MLQKGTKITTNVHNKVRGGEIIHETEGGYLAEFYCPERVARKLTMDEFVPSENYALGDV